MTIAVNYGKKRKIINDEKREITRLLSPIIFLLLWQSLRWFGIIDPNFFPGPSDIIQAFFVKLGDPRPDGSTLPEHIWSSFRTSTTGFILAVIVGVPLGFIHGLEKIAG